MTLESKYMFTCDAGKCGIRSAAQEDNYTLPEGWSQLNIGSQDYNKRKTLHYCPKCTGAIQDGFAKIEEDYSA